MKKHIFFLGMAIAFATTVVGQRFQTSEADLVNENTRYVQTVPEGTIFYEGFENAERPSLPGNWNTQSLSNEGFITGTAGNAPGQTNENGFWPVPLHGIFALTNDDVCNCNKSQDRLNSPLINAALTEELVIQFAAFQNGSGSQSAYLEIKASGLPWTKLIDIPASNVWKTYRANIPAPFLKSSFQFRFYYDDQGNYASGLAVDDIFITKGSIESLSLNSLYAIDESKEGSGQFYHSIPRFQARSARWSFSGLIDNNTADRKNARLHVKIDGPVSYDDTSVSVLLNSKGVDTVGFATINHFSPYALGTYDLTAKLLSDSADPSQNDNSLNASFRVSDSVYSRVPTTFDNSTGMWLQETGERYGTGFYFHKPDTIRAVKVNIHPASSAGARFRVKIFSYDTLSSSIFSTSPIELTTEDIGNVVRIPLNRNISIGRYLIVIEKEAGSGNLVIAARKNPAAVERNALTKKVLEDWKSTPYFAQIELIMRPVNQACPGHIQYSIQNQSCVGLNDGSITTIALDANAPFTYNWSNGSGNVPSITNLAPGLYDLFVTDAENCIYEEHFEILASDTLEINPITTLDSCDRTVGKIDLNISGGTRPYSILWNGKQGLAMETGLESGTYFIDLTDAHGCTASDTVHLEGTENIAIAFGISAPSCNNSDGQLSVTPFGTNPFSYLWNTGDTTNTLTGVEAGIYTLTLTDSIGCSTSARAFVNNANAPSIVIDEQENNACYGNSTGSISINVGGGTLPFSYLWSNSATTQDIENLSSGIYTLTLTDNAGCKAFKSAEIILSSVPMLLDFNERGNYCWNGNKGIVEAIASGGEPPYNYAWSNGENSSEIINLESGTYTLTVTDQNACTRSLSTKVSEGVTFFTKLDSVNKDTADNLVDEGKIFVTSFGGTPPFSHIWNDSIFKEDLINVPFGQYVLTVKDQLGCVDIFTYSLTIGPDGMTDQVHQANLNVFPNPISSGGILQIQFPKGVNRLVVYDASGRQLHQSIVSRTAYELPLSGWVNGVYFLKAQSNFATWTLKFIVQ